MSDKKVSIESFDVRPSVLKLSDGAEVTVFPSVIDVDLQREKTKDGQPIYNFASSLQFRLTKLPAEPKPELAPPASLHSITKH